MTSILTLVSTVFLLQPIGGPGARALQSSERVALEAAGAPALARLRAGAASSRSELAPGERAALAQAAQAARDLADLRAGEITLSDRDVKVILITAAAIVLLVLIF